ncbi:MAG TPA: hypothetical protein VIJ25_06040, partial [Methylococcales bacterium]
NSNWHIDLVISTSGLEATNTAVLISSHTGNVLHASYTIIDQGISDNVTIGISFLSVVHQML